MKKKIAIVLAMLLTLTSLTGCLGSDEPTAEDASAYVQAVLDLMCTGDYDHSVELSDVEEGKESEIRDELIQDAMEDAGADDDSLSEEELAKYTEIMTKAMELADYTVGEVAETEDGGFDVTVSIRPLDIFNSIEEKLDSKIDEDYDRLVQLSDEELETEIMNMMFDILEENLESPVYTSAQEVTVRYGLLDEEENLYGISDEDGEKLGEMLFYVPDDLFEDEAEE